MPFYMFVSRNELLHATALGIHNRRLLTVALFQDVEEKVEKTFPNAINKWAIQEARCVLEKGKKRSVVLPVEKVHNLLVKVGISN